MYRYKHTIGTFQLPYSGETSTEGRQSETLQSSSKSPNKVIHCGLTRAIYIYQTADLPSGSYVQTWGKRLIVSREMKVRHNDRGVKENFSSGEHKNIATLKQEKTLLKEAGIDRYLSKEIAPYPEAPEFHLSKVAHVTTKRGLDGILKSGGFKGGEKSFLWCNLPVDDDDIIAAECRYLEKIFPDRTPEQRQIQQPFLSKFTTSPAFRKASRFGNFRFTFSLSDLLMMYSQQICGGEEPVLRVYETVVYKQEIMYTVLVHSPDNKEFEKYPVLGDGSDDALCAYMRGNIVWRAQAMSKTHAFGLAIDEVNQNVGTEGGGMHGTCGTM
ncbi:uncharacterized protein LOC135535740 [Oncorhynchus masou masou]|uniref:uncharacterized protein LOC135535740 n=1 Tax=Oncorhynchus masou masou TaxID=90313 RepID=UPI0031831F49